jgi:hypothetical protein
VKPNSLCACGWTKHPQAIKCAYCQNRKWTDAEEQMLIEMTEFGTDRRHIAVVLNRTVYSVAARGTKLGLKKDREAILQNRKLGRDEFWNDEERVADWKRRVAKQFTHLDRKIRAEELRQRNRTGVTSFAGRHHTPEVCERISAAQKGRRFTPEHRAKISKARKRYWIRWRISKGRLPRKINTGSFKARNFTPKSPIYGLPVSMTFPQSIRGECSVGDVRVKLAPQETKILEILLLRGKGYFTGYHELIEMMWPDPDDEPEDAMNCLSVYVCKLRNKGIAIDTRHGFGVGIAR